MLKRCVTCYIKFALKPLRSEEHVYSDDTVIANSLVELFLKLKRSILYQKSAYLLSNLFKDLTRMFAEQSIPPIFISTKELKNRLIDRFNGTIGFFPAGLPVVVHSPDMNPCLYSVATLKGFGLRDQDLLKAFWNMIKCKIKEREHVVQFLLKIQQMDTVLEKGPLKDHYNAVFATINPNFTLTDNGYAVIRISATRH